jgi:squalene-hopene/tetraprenyl-beta-curcumene cyclase
MKRVTLFALLPGLLLVPLIVGSGSDLIGAQDAVAQPGPNRADEPLAARFSLAQAARFLDTAAMDWTRRQNCFTCHTNYAYLLARPALPQPSEAHPQVRQALEEQVAVRWPARGPRWDAEVVMSAAVLAHHDTATTGRLHASTRKALDRMWQVQREDGGFEWLKCNWPPMESDDHFGATMAAIAVGVAPEGYARTPAAREGLARLRAYLERNPPPTLHHTGMLLWAASYARDLISDEQRQDGVRRLLALQKADGGWSLATLGDWSRADGKPQDTASSDGYGTGFVLYVLRRAGVPSSHARIRKGVRWLEQHQRASGRWFTRSLNRDTHHFLTHAGTAFAVLALNECEARPRAVLSAREGGAMKEQGKANPTTTAEGWTLAWSDEFERDGPPDPKNWNPENGFVRNDEAQWYQPENAFCRNGHLILEARRERVRNPRFDQSSTDWRRNREFAEYTSASLTTRGRHQWQYGRFEMKARIDTREGLWPAFWTLGVSGEWPKGGEIDIMEYYRGTLLANAAWGTEKRWVPRWNSVKKPITEFNDPDWSGKFHVWRMDWDESAIQLSVDGLVLNTVDLRTTVNADGKTNPFRRPQYILLNLAIGGTNGGDPAKTAFPARFEIDYVRVYQKPSP